MMVGHDESAYGRKNDGGGGQYARSVSVGERRSAGVQRTWGFESGEKRY